MSEVENRIRATVDDLFFKIYLALKRRVVRHVSLVVVLGGGFTLGWISGESIFMRILFGVLGLIAPIAFYLNTVLMIQRPGFIEISHALLFGIVVGIGVVIWIGSVFIDLTLSSGFALAIIGGALGLIWTYLNVYFYQGGEE